MEPRPYYNAVIATENHLHFFTGRRIACNRLVNTSFVNTFTKLHDRCIPSAQQPKVGQASISPETKQKITEEIKMKADD